MLPVIKYSGDIRKEEPLYREHVTAIDKRLYASSLSRSLIEVLKIAAHGLTDPTYQQRQRHFSNTGIADLIVCICHINFLNRIGIATRTVATE